MLVVPADALEASVDDAIAAGAQAIVAITGGVEDGDAGGARDAALAAKVRAAGVRLLGPNCLGVFDAAAELELVSNDLPAGSLALVSQSGNLALEIAGRAAAVGLGFSRFVSLGNQVDVQAAEVVRGLADARADARGRAVPGGLRRRAARSRAPRWRAWRPASPCCC